MSALKKDTKITSQDANAQDGQNALSQRAAALNLPFLAKKVKIAREALDVISKDIAKKYRILAFEKNRNVVKVAMTDPQDIEALNILRFISQNKNIELEIYLVDEQLFQDLIAQYEGGAETMVAEAMKSLQGDMVDDGSFEMQEAKKEESDQTAEVLQAAPVTKLLSVIIRHAIEGKASDIHIEPFDKEYRVRFRVDGVLHSSLSVPKEVGRAVVSRIKILSNLKIDEKRKPQDGRFRIVENAHAVDFRVSTLPIVDGEKVVLRILDTDNKLADLETMGLLGKGSEILLRNIKQPYGIILITGPTGSGKSTTLYACLSILNQEEANIITLEDPVEYSIAGINQSQINPEIGYSFASGLRSILRQDPNVIMVGEIRDGETAELTIHAALTGHLVLSTLHTNSSIGAIPRLVDMGIEPFLLSSSLRVVAAQRLVRRICEHCKEEIPVPKNIKENILAELQKMDPAEIKKYDVTLADGVKFFQGKGCEECANSGYKGRIAIFEALEVDADMKEIISEKNGNEADVERHAQKQGMVTIKQDGILKVIKGLTTFSEVERVTEGSLSIGGEVEDDKG